MPGKPSSLLDIFFSNASQRIDGVENITNITSEHDGVKYNIHVKKCHKKTNFTLRTTKNLTYMQIKPLLNENYNLQHLFNYSCPNTIAQMLMNGLNTIANTLITKK